MANFVAIDSFATDDYVVARTDHATESSQPYVEHPEFFIAVVDGEDDVVTYARMSAARDAIYNGG